MTKKEFLKKILSASQLVFEKKNFFRRILWVKTVDSPAFQAFLAHPENAFKASAGFFKQGHIRSVVRIEIDNQAYVVKRYRFKNAYYKWIGLFKPSQAAKAWRITHLLQFYQIPTTPPVAIIEKRWGWLRREAYFVTEFLEGKLLEHMPKTSQQKYKEQVLAQIDRMHALHITHGDLNYRNILLTDDGPVIFDLDTAKTHRFTFIKKKYIAKDYARFFKFLNRK